jgi:glycosyltransferase involved in cell wall biosynthesis
VDELVVEFDVLLPVYNAADTLLRTLESIFEQAYLPTNLIIIINGCSDASEKIADKFTLDNRVNIVKVVFAENAGLVGALNAGLNECTSLWVARIDADDYWLSDHLLNLRNGILKGDVNLGLIAGSASIMKDDKLVSCSAVLDDAGIRKFLVNDNPFVHSAVAFKLSVIETVGPYNLSSIFEDYDLWIRILAKYKGEIISSQMCVHIRSSQSLTAGYRLVDSLKERLKLQYTALRLVSNFTVNGVFRILVTCVRWFFNKIILAISPKEKS